MHSARPLQRRAPCPLPRYQFYGVCASSKEPLLIGFAVPASGPATATFKAPPTARDLVPQLAEMWQNCLAGFER